MSTKAANPVQRILVDFGAGRIGEADAVAKLEKALVPRHVYPPAANVTASYERERNDYVPPITDGSADEITLALVDGTLTEAQAMALFTKVREPPPVVDKYTA